MELLLVQDAAEVARCRQELHSQECQSPRMVHYFQCDGCGMLPLIGTRFTCPVCLDYDLCSSCHHRAGHEHRMLQVHKGIVCDGCSKPLLGRRHMCTVCLNGASYDLCHECFVKSGHRHKMLEVHQGVVCDSCGQEPLLGKRYKCRVCPDYDICAVCDRRRLHPHDMYEP